MHRLLSPGCRCTASIKRNWLPQGMATQTRHCLTHDGIHRSSEGNSDHVLNVSVFWKLHLLWKQYWDSQSVTTASLSVPTASQYMEHIITTSLSVTTAVNTSPCPMQMLPTSVRWTGLQEEALQEEKLQSWNVGLDAQSHQNFICSLIRRCHDQQA